jgi:hypothetical protein
MPQDGAATLRYPSIESISPVRGDDDCNGVTMNVTTNVFAILVASLCLALPATASEETPDSAPPAGANQRVTPMTAHATGTFDVKLAPQEDPDAGESAVGRMSLDKQFHGDLEATAKGQMLAVQGSVEGSAGYVAMERVSGTLDGRRGSFVLQHSGTMTRGTPELRVSVVPDSGTGELAGLAGTMTIEIADGEHRYDFAYTVQAPH